MDKTESKNIEYLYHDYRIKEYKLQKLNLINAMNKCQLNPQYKIVIFVSTSTKAKMIIDEMLKSYESENIMPKKYDKFIIEFKNGSCIKFIYGASEARGNRYNDILYLDMPKEDNYLGMGLRPYNYNKVVE